MASGEDKPKQQQQQREAEHHDWQIESFYEGSSSSKKPPTLMKELRSGLDALMIAKHRDGSNVPAADTEKQPKKNTQ